MAKKPTARSETVLYDVIYEDGSQRSNRRVPSGFVEGMDGGDHAVRAELARQDREIAARSGMPPLTIKTIRRSDKK